MINNNNILVVIPARGGSKGIALKNIQKLNGKPLVTLVGDIVSHLDFVDRAIVSTDHHKIAEVARASGLAVPFMRPKELSGDIVSDIDVITHALFEVEKIDNKIYDIVVMLQPTSPMRKPEHVSQAVKKLINEKLDAVWTVSETDSKNHPLKQLIVINNRLKYYDKEGPQIIARQQLSNLYHRNGAAYALTRECIVEQKMIKGAKTGAYVILDVMINIDTLWDFKLAEFLMSEGKKKKSSG